MTRTIELPVCGLKVELAGGGGTITSDLTGEEYSHEYLIAIDALESLILGHAVAGVDVAAPAYLQGIETALEAIWNRFPL